MATWKSLCWFAKEMKIWMYLSSGEIIELSLLSLMARDLLSIPITTVASKSTFSIGGRVIGKYQSSILPENAQVKLGSRDWLYGHQAYDDSEEEDDVAIDVDKIATKMFD